MISLVRISTPKISAILSFMVAILICQQVFSQMKEERALSKIDSTLLSALPELKFPGNLRSIELPGFVDNSKYRYFRSILEQVGTECGQLSAVSYAFGYEINRLRNLSSHIPENQYPSHFTFNFMNGGYGWTGVSYHHSVEILKKCGCMNVTDYGGVSSDPSWWISGYDKYLNGMFNRAEGLYQIKVRTEQGLETLKQYLHNHLEGDSIGGIACFYACSPWNTKVIPEGSPEAGKHVIPEWGNKPTHAMTIVGYNDSVCWDYNGDGQITNHLDINGDSIIDMRDWEKGALIFSDGFFGGTQFADSGFCYMMYKTLAESFRNGGIWNHAVHVVRAIKDYEPKLTYKVRLKHTSRNKIRVTAGITQPEKSNSFHTIAYPIFNFQGGSQYMQGGNTTEEHKTIEFGLDVTPLLSYAPITDTSFFQLIVDEEDPLNLGQGSILEFSMFEHTGGSVMEISSIYDTVDIQNNGKTILGIKYIPQFQGPKIQDDELPVAIAEETYVHQMTCTGGVPPYQWELVPEYQVGILQQEVPQIQGADITPEYLQDGKTMVPLEFGFPFYGCTYDTIFVHVDGFIMLEDEDLPWPYQYDPELLLKNVHGIAAWPDRHYAIIDENEGIRYQGNDKEAWIHWKASQIYYNDTIPRSFVVYINDTGIIKIFLEKRSENDLHHDYTGISAGDQSHYKSIYFPAYLHDQDIMAEFHPVVYPPEIQLSENGLFDFIPQNRYQDIDLFIRATGQAGLFHYKGFKFNSSYSNIPGTQANREELLIFPNPCRDKFHVQFDEDASYFKTFKVFDNTGQIIVTKTFPGNKGQYTINLTGFPDGIYYVMAELNGRKLMGKAIKSN